jgi:glucose-1-phosphate thymidylyltransferase
MKALVLSGGTGSRLRPLTYTSAKQLIPVANKPILFYGLEAIRDAGITEVGIIVGDTRREVMEAVGDGTAFGLRVTYIPQDAPRGLAHAVLTAEEFINGEPFLMYLGDNLLRDGVAAFAQRFREDSAEALILLSRVSDPQRFGVAELEGSRVVRLVEKPREPKSDLALVGVYLFDRHIFEAARSIRPSERGELEITDAIQHLIDRGRRVESVHVNGWWKDTGKPEDVLDANRLLLEHLEPAVRGSVDPSSRLVGRVVVEEGARVVDSEVRGPSIIGAGARVENSYVGPYTAIGRNVTVRGSEVECSVVMEDSQILDLGTRITDSLIGRGVTVCRSPERPRAVRLVLGDHSWAGMP